MEPIPVFERDVRLRYNYKIAQLFTNCLRFPGKHLTTKDNPMYYSHKLLGPVEERDSPCVNWPYYCQFF
jgi:hypothetical protein